MTIPPQPPIDGEISSFPEPDPELLGERYILDQVGKTRRTLNRTRIISLITGAVFLAYMGFMTVKFGQFLAPKSAAEIANNMIAQRVTDDGPDIAAQIRQQVPVLIAQIPDYVQQQLPSYREGLENRFESDLTHNLDASSVQLDKDLDTYLDNHKDEIKLALTSGKDSDAIHQLGDGVSQEFLASLKTTKMDGESLQDKLDTSLVSLSQIQAKMDRLANAKDLTPQEKKTRHAIAIMTQTINRTAPHSLPIATAANF